ncbi:MAG TPA: hypothetical protein VNA13_00165 [Xanthomonadales bacterium]|nr:hypothetical protein [Xanthomonadales bacterium]
MSDKEPSIEKPPVSSSNPLASAPSTITLQKAVDLGEYNPEYLSTFPEWHTLSNVIQWQMIKQALDNRERRLVKQWAEINNVIDFSEKPHLQEALRNIEKQRRKLMGDKEKLMVEYSSKG